MRSDTPKGELQIRRALITVSDKTGVVDLAKALIRSGAEIVATGKTAELIVKAGIAVTPIEKVSGSPEAFQGRMKTLSFPVCSGILYRRGDEKDEADLKKLSITPIDCVVVNFYPFEAAAARDGITPEALIEEVDVGGPTLVRAAAKNAPDVLVLTDPLQYARVIEELGQNETVMHSTAQEFAGVAWNKILKYDQAIADKLGQGRSTRKLRYGENPHQKAELQFDPDGPIDWDSKLTPQELSYNNIWDLSSAYALASDLREIAPDSTGVVIVKHNNPCGVSLLPRTAKAAGTTKAAVNAIGVPADSSDSAQKQALLKAWEGDPVSAFGGVLVFTDPIEGDTALWLSEKFVELIAAPGLHAEHPALKILLARRKNLKAVSIRRFGEMPAETQMAVPGGRLVQSSDTGNQDPLRSVTKTPWPENRTQLARFGIAVTRALKSNAVALVRESSQGDFQLIGAGQGQPNRIEALEKLAIPRALGVLKEIGGKISECILISDAFFPFRDTVDAAHQAGIRYIIQPGGSLKDVDSVLACDETGICMAFTGVRHFKH